MKIHLDNTHSVGLGDNLCLISLFANTDEYIDLHVDNRHNTFDRLQQLKKIFMIGDDNLTITEAQDNGTFKNVGWPLKLNTDYYRAKQVNVNGQILDTVTDNDGAKPCIAMAAFYENEPENHNNEWPWCKRRDIDYWSRIFGYLKSCGHEVLTVDRHYFDLESKIESMVKNCKAIISYEGGMAHLAHMLNIPLLLVDWTYPAPSTVLDRFHCEFVHMSDSMYILRDDEELFKWNKDKLEKVIFSLRHSRTNNRLVNQQCKINFTGPGIYGDIFVTDRHNQVQLRAPGLFSNQDEANIFVSDHWDSNGHFTKKT